MLRDAPYLFMFADFVTVLCGKKRSPREVSSGKKRKKKHGNTTSESENQEKSAKNKDDNRAEKNDNLNEDNIKVADVSKSK